MMTTGQDFKIDWMNERKVIEPEVPWCFHALLGRSWMPDDCARVPSGCVGFEGSDHLIDHTLMVMSHYGQYGRVLLTEPHVFDLPRQLALAADLAARYGLVWAHGHINDGLHGRLANRKFGSPGLILPLAFGHNQSVVDSLVR